MKLAIFGGTFNPLHIGHCMLAETVAVERGYDRILFVPTNIPPHKQMHYALPAAARFAMLEDFCRSAACGMEQPFHADDCEIKRGGISYTFDTVCAVLQKYEEQLDAPPALIVGQETALQFGKWHNAAGIAERAELIIARRRPDSARIDTTGFLNEPLGEYAADFSDNTDVAAALAPLNVRYSLLENPLLPVSSTEIRARIAQRKSWRYLVPDSVFRYITQRGFYSDAYDERQSGRCGC